jgi:hypothetical protein
MCKTKKYYNSSSSPHYPIITYLLVLVFIPCIVYLLTSYIPGGVYTVYTQENTSPSYLEYYSYISGNLSCTHKVQPWYFAQSTTPLLVYSYGNRIRLLSEKGFRVKVGVYGEMVDLFSQHYLYIQVSSLDEVLQVQKQHPKLEVLYFYSAPVRDFTDYAYGKELRGDGYGSAKTFISDWEYTHYVMSHSKSIQYHMVNTTDYADADLLQKIYDLLPQKYYPIEKFVTCAYSYSTTAQELSFKHRCEVYKERYPVLKGEGVICDLIT